MTSGATLRSRVGPVQRRALLLGVVAGGVCVAGYVLNATQFFRSYLMAYTFWLGIVLGCLALLMLHHLVGGLWGVAMRRVLEAATRLLPLLLLCGVPLLLGAPELYPWTHAQDAAAHGAAHVPPFRQMYMHVPFVLGRVGFYWAVWLLLALFLNRWSRQQDQTDDAVVVRARRRSLGLLSSGGLVLYGLTVTFSAVDWIMSLEAHWFSTIYGFLVVTGQFLGAMAFAVLITVWLAREGPLAAVVSPGLLNDLGNLLLAFVLLWAYISFAQFLIIWYGNLPEEIHWYLHRAQGGWGWIWLALLVLHFALPLFLLLSRRTKRQGQWLTAVAGLICGMHLVDVFWLVMPAFFPARLHVHWLDIAAPVALGGLLLAVFLWQLCRRALLPLHEPRLQEVIPHG